MANEQKQKEIGTIKLSQTDVGLRIDISGDLAQSCGCCGPGSKDGQSETDCCSGSEGKAQKL